MMNTQKHTALPMRPPMSLMVLAAVLSLALIGCMWLYRYENKYTHAGPQASGGMLLAGEGFPAENPVIYLVEGWAYYADRLLAPADFAGDSSPLPDEYVFLGQYGGFDRGDFARSPHGCASYRLRIRLPDEPCRYTLELPEIFSAYRLYIDGEQAAQMGVPESEDYRPGVGTRTVTVEAAGTVELLFAVSDYTHLYSGMVYPPAFGEQDAVGRLLAARLLLRGALCTAALVIGLLALLVGLLAHRGPAVRYGLLCLCFIGHAGYPLWRSFLAIYGPFYLLENLSFCALLLLAALCAGATLVQQPQCEKNHKRRWERLCLWIGGVMLTATLVVHAHLSQSSLATMAVYSVMVTLYQWLVAGFLTVFSFAAAKRGQPGSWSLLCGILVLDMTIIMDRLLPLYEPIVSGWFVELGTAVLIVCIGIATGGDIAVQYRRGAVLADRAHSAERLLAVQKTYHGALEEQAAETRRARHDLRHHAQAMEELLKAGQYQELKVYLAQYAEDLSPRENPSRHCAHLMANAVADYYARVARAADIALEMRLDIPPDTFWSDTDLCGVLSNLLENAVEACRLPGKWPAAESSLSTESCFPAEKQRAWIALHVQSTGVFALHMENSVSPQRIVPDEGFLSAKGRGRVGYGLASVQAAAERYGGTAQFRYERARGVFVSTVLIGQNGKAPTCGVDCCEENRQRKSPKIVE